MIPMSTADLRRASERLFARGSRLVGWGSGSVFDYFQELHPLRLDYLVDNDSGRWSHLRHGLEIVPPDRLASDRRADAFVVIYSSSWPEIQRQLNELGDFRSLPASAVFADAGTRAKLAWSEEIAARPATVRRPNAKNAIVVQGPVVDGVTTHVLRVLTALHPHDQVILSTWDDTEAQSLAEASAAADDVVLSAKPAHGGIQNRNHQIVSTRAGIARAIEHGARTVLKTRTDLAVLASPLFDQARWWLDRVGGGAARAAGLRRRLIVPSSFTRKFLLYHPADLVMLGDAEDLLQFWSAPLDPRSGELLTTPRLDQSIAAVNMDGNPTESYLGLQFCRAIGRRAPGTLADSWTFYRDLFAVVDNDWFDLLWFKNLSIPDAAIRRGPRQTVSQQFWQRLAFDVGDLSDEASSVDPAGTSLRTFACAGS